MRYYTLILLFYFLGCNQFALVAQELPPISVFQSQDYKAEAQNWAISQDENKHIYVANNSGLLEYNGAQWKLYSSPNETIMRSVNVIDDKIYTGCYMEFGYWQKNAYGHLDYTSLSQSINNKLLEDEEFWSILAIDNWIIFQSLNRLYVFDVTNDSIKIIDSKTRLTKVFKVNNTIYFQSINEGLYIIKNGKAVIVSDDEIVKDNIIVNLFFLDSKLIILTQNKGFYQLTGNKIEEWSIFDKNRLKNKSVYSGILLQDGSFALGTISNGLIILNQEGTLINEINQARGLSNNTVLSLFEDKDKNIWLGLNNGINVIHINSPYTIYNDYKGVLGTTYISIVHKNKLYLGTNQGLFFKDLNSKNDFQFIDGTKGQVWCLKELKGTLFCGHNNGTYIINDKTAQLISNENGTWDIISVLNNENLLIQGNYNGLFVLKNENDTWYLRNKINGFDISSKHFQMNNDSVLFVSHEYKGVFKVTLNSDYSAVQSYERVININKGTNSSLTKFNNTIHYANKEGIFKYNGKNDKFIKDSILSKVYTESGYISGKLVNDKKENKLWAFGLNYLYTISKGSFSNKPKVDKIVFPNSLSDGLSGYENISNIGDGKYLIGSSLGYIILDTGKIDEENQYSIEITEVSNKSINKSSTLLNLNLEERFKHKDNYFQFQYSIPSFNKYYQSEYQFILEGLHKEWSSWTKEPYHSFENIPSGNYTFKVRGKVGSTITSNIASYSFTIDKPFYLSNLAILFYILFLIGFSLFMHNLYKAYYKRKQVKLLTETERELELKELENRQQLMRFKNESLEQDIENKNRELAISTMSLIKKNEFLNTIKSELHNSRDKMEVKKIIRLIDSNINNKDDWNFFEEAFNNADKDFLKKIKSKHPGLTPNDLKLCAYLRLNLSSKEIAPLLNISVKSVEVKRYRLRKKMNLAHESSLTNYILDI